MPAAIPIQRKTPFLIDPHPLLECSSAHAGALSVSRVLRSLGLPGLGQGPSGVLTKNDDRTPYTWTYNITLSQRAPWRGCPGRTPPGAGRRASFRGARRWHIR